MSGRVVGIVDGDTIDLLTTDGGRYEPVRVRLIEIDTPERGQPWGNRAKQALAEKVFQQDVEVDVLQATDAYGRSLGRIWLGNRDINRELVRKGHAWAYREYLMDPSFLEDEQTARDEGLGLWSSGDAVPPWNWRLGSRSAATIPAPTDDLLGDCDVERTCGAMSSCTEAMYYFKQCGVSRLDGDKDGVPCESLCR